MTQEEIEREIAERLAAVLGEDATAPGNVGNWLAVAREVMVMMERVALRERKVSDEFGFAKQETPVDLSPAIQDE